jgi:hypothetical protein
MTVACPLNVVGVDVDRAGAAAAASSEARRTPTPANRAQRIRRDMWKTPFLWLVELEGRPSRRGFL